MKIAVKTKDGLQWITAHPNGAGSKGTPVQINKESGEVVAGLGGKFTGKHISEVKGKGKGKEETKTEAKTEAGKETTKKHDDGYTTNSKNERVFKTRKPHKLVEKLMSEGAYIRGNSLKIGYDSAYKILDTPKLNDESKVYFINGKAYNFLEAVNLVEKNLKNLSLNLDTLKFNSVFDVKKEYKDLAKQPYEYVENKKNIKDLTWSDIPNTNRLVGAPIQSETEKAFKVDNPYWEDMNAFERAKTGAKRYLWIPKSMSTSQYEDGLNYVTSINSNYEHINKFSQEENPNKAKDENVKSIRVGEDVKSLINRNKAENLNKTNNGNPNGVKLSEILSGGKGWEKYGKKRTYFSNGEKLAKMLGIYENNSVFIPATENTKAISFSRSREKEFLQDLASAYYDHVDNKFVMYSRVKDADGNEIFNQKNVQELFSKVNYEA